MSYTAIPHDWMMTNGKYADSIDFYTNSYGRDGLGHGGDGDYSWSGKNGGLSNRDLDGKGIFLEECRAKDCFFGCGGSHLSHFGHVGHHDLYDKDWGYDIDDGQDGFNTPVFGKPFVESDRFARSPMYPFTIYYF